MAGTNGSGALVGNDGARSVNGKANGVQEDELMATQPVQTTEETHSVVAAPIRVILADAQAIYRVGIRKIFGLEDDIRVVAQAENLQQAFSAAIKFPADVILLETTMCPDPADAISEILKHSPLAKIVMVTSNPDREDTIEYIRRGARGVVSRSITPELLVRCIRKVAEGESWLDKRGISRVFDAYRAQAAQLASASPRPRLSEKELLIISGVTQGMRNKEIAHEIGTTEQVVKNYLRKIYDKLGVADRLELALFCVHNQVLDGVQLRRKGAVAGGNGSSSPNGSAGPNGSSGLN
jgi:DNA-binding NarL/FixJ family response regulator